MDIFEDTSIYEVLFKEENKLSDEKLPHCILINGIVDLNSLSNQIQSLFISKPTIIQIYGQLFFILINSDVTIFNQNIKKQLDVMHYDIFSIFLKNSLANSIISQFNTINPNNFYICAKHFLNLGIINKYCQKVQDDKGNHFYLYKFNNFTDLVDSYIKLIYAKTNWPYFAILPPKFYSKFNIPKKITSSKNILTFSPLMFNYYFSFIDSNQLKSKRIKNVSKMYSISNINDLQINHLYNENPQKTYYLTIRTFLGFDSKFRCLYAFEYLLHKSKSSNCINDLQLLDDFQFKGPKIKYNLFYIETNSLLFNNSIMFSINCKESFSFNGLIYFSFCDLNDFSEAKQILMSSLDNNNSIFIINNLKFIEKDDFQKFFKVEIEENLVFMMFQMKDFSEKSIFLSFFKHYIMIKELFCSIENEYYVVVGFKSNELRNECFLNIKTNQKIVIFNDFIPYSKKIKSLALNKKIENQDNSIVDIKNYILKNCIGQGSYGFVHIVEKISNHEIYAAKIKSSKKSNNNTDFLQEIEFYRKFKFPLILSFHGYSLKDFNDKNNPVILLEYMSNGSLEDNLKKWRKSPSDKIFQLKKYNIVYGIAKAMEFLHKKGVFHRDLKPGNILLNDNFFPKLCDFGLSFIINENNFKNKKEEIGTIKYMAPEIIKEKDCNSSPVDVYSFSLIAYELLTGNDFFTSIKYAKVPKQLQYDVIKGVRPDLSDIHDEEILVFFQRCWSSEASERPTFSEICETLSKKKFQLAYQADELEILKFKYWYNDHIENSNSNLLSMQQAESKENIDLMIEYANRLYLGIDMPVNKEEAFRLFKKGVEYKNVDSMYYLGHYSIEYNQYLKNEADLGHEKAMIEYGKRLLDENDKKAFFYFKKAADLGNDQGMYHIGKMLYNGKGIKMNKKEASEYFQLSADLGNVQSMFEFACMLHQGDGIEIDYKKASEYYKMAAFYGNVNSMTNLGLMLKDGKLPVDLKESAHYLKKAADLGDPEAMFHYGNLICVKALIGECDYESETEESYEKAAEYFKKAEAAGNIEASVRYGMLFTKRLIQTDDMREPIQYLKRAAYKGNTNGILQYLGVINSYFEYRDAFTEKEIDFITIERVVLLKKLKQNGNQQIDFVHETLGLFSNPLKSFIKNDHCLDDDYEEDEEEEESKNHKISKKKVIDLLSLFQYNNNESNKSIKEVEINGYESFQLNSDQYYFYLSQFSVPLKIQKEIDNEFKSFLSLEKKQFDICHPNDPNDLYTFYFFPSHFHNFIQNTILNIMKKSNIQCFFPQTCESSPFENYLYFNESLFPTKYLAIFFKKLETIQEISEIKHNIFDGKQIATYLIVKKGTEKSIIESIRNFLLQQKILFKTFVYPLQNNIIINEKIMLKDSNDFNVILKEIKSHGLKPIYYQRNMLFLYEFYPQRKLFEQFSFICFQNNFEKMEAINHLNNSIIFNHKNKKYVKYDIDYFYSSFNENIFSEKAQKFIPEIFQHLKGFKEITQKVVSIESPVERTYVGFDTLRHLKKAHILFMKKIKIIQTCINEPKLFWKKKGNYYLVIEHDLNLNINDLFAVISDFASDIQECCTELNEKNEIIYMSYFGYSTQNDVEKAKKLLNMSKIIKQNNISYHEYNENKYFLLIDEPREAYLFYDSL